MNELTTLQKVLAAVGLPAAGALTQHLWARYRRRLAMLRWTVQYQPMAFATEDLGWGKVQILYNDVPTQNLHMVYVQVQNASSQDLENVRIDLHAGQGTLVLRSQGACRASLQFFPFGGDYVALLAEAATRPLTKQELDHWGPRSPFVIPVLNRGAIAEFKLLVSRQDYATPQVGVSCDHKGVRVVHQPFVQEVLGVRQGQATVVGLALTIAASGAAVAAEWPTWVVASVAWGTGAFAQALGALAVRAWRWFIALAD